MGGPTSEKEGNKLCYKEKQLRKSDVPVSLRRSLRAARKALGGLLNLCRLGMRHHCTWQPAVASTRLPSFTKYLSAKYMFSSVSKSLAQSLPSVGFPSR
eukprot:186479-Amphidinium_carterae.2